jgi:TetR/AcrR family transcriptional regulator
MVKDTNTEHRIYEAARRVFMEKGLSGARMQEIADEAGINKALLHYYFRNKEKLFEGIFSEVIMRISDGLSDTFKMEMDVMGRIHSLVDIYIDVLTVNRYLPLFVLNEMNHNPEKFSQLFAKHIVVHMKKFILQIQDEVERGLIRPIHPVHLLLNTLGLIIFPFAALPVMYKIMEKAAIEGGVPELNIDDFLKQRKQIVYEFIENALVIKKS